MNAILIMLVVLLSLGCAAGWLLRPASLPFAVPCLPEGVPSVEAWEPRQLSWVTDRRGRAWVEGFYLAHGRPLRALWLTPGLLALVDLNPHLPTPAWIDSGVLQPGSTPRDPVVPVDDPAQTCRWRLGTSEGELF